MTAILDPWFCFWRNKYQPRNQRPQNHLSLCFSGDWVKSSYFVHVFGLFSRGGIPKEFRGFIEFFQNLARFLIVGFWPQHLFWNETLFPVLFWRGMSSCIVSFWNCFRNVPGTISTKKLFRIQNSRVVLPNPQPVKKVKKMDISKTTRDIDLKVLDSYFSLENYMGIGS